MKRVLSSAERYERERRRMSVYTQHHDIERSGQEEIDFLIQEAIALEEQLSCKPCYKIGIRCPRAKGFNPASCRLVDMSQENLSKNGYKANSYAWHKNQCALKMLTEPVSCGRISTELHET